MAHFTKFYFEFFYEIFAEDASQPLLYHGAKKVKNDQKLKSRVLHQNDVILSDNHGVNMQ